MNAKRVLNREHDELIIPEGFFFEPYDVATGGIISPSLLVKLKYVKMYLSADASVTFKDAAGNDVSAFPLKAGPQPFLVSEISVVSSGSVAIIHDGVQNTTNTDMTSKVYGDTTNPNY